MLQSECHKIKNRKELWKTMNVGGELEVTVFVFARLHRLKQMLGRKKRADVCQSAG